MATLDDIISTNTSGYNASAFGQILSAVSHFEFGRTAQEAEEFKAAQLRQQAGQVMAASQRTAADVDIQSRLIASHALAVAAASGGGASDPGVVALMARNAQEGAYRQATALYGGEDRARALRLSADAAEFQGKETALNSDEMAVASLYGAHTTLMKRNASNASMYQRFGAGSPSDPDQ